MIRFFFTICFVTLFALESTAQYYHTPFGHNRIQYKKFDWYYYTTNNFEVYYYPGGKEYAKQALGFLEEEFTELTDILGYAPYTKTKIFIYNSIQDLQQSNIGIGGDVFTIGGKTDFVKLQVELAYPGSAHAFKQEMVYDLSHILIKDMMFGGSLAEIFQNSYLLSLPEWFIRGAARYLAYGWSQDMDDYVRDYLSRKDIKKLVKIQNEEAEIVGQSIWNYIAIKYGRSNISNILNLTRIIRNEENSISSTLGLSFRQFLTDWKNYYTLQAEEIGESYRKPDDEDEVAGYSSRDVVISQMNVNVAGSHVAYTYHKNGKWEVNVVEVESGKKKTLISGGYLINDQQIDYHLPLVDWQDNETLGVLFYKRGNLYLNTYHVKDGLRQQKPLSRFRQVESFSFNDNGKLVIISGDIDGQNDLFLISMRRNAVKRVTNDLYDDLDPVFVPGTAALVFSSNRVLDSVKVKDVDLESVGDNYNLFVYDLDTTTHKFLRLTNTFSRDRKPLAKNEYEIFYLSDQKGISNLYKYSLLDSTFVQLSDFQHSILDYDLTFDKDQLYFIMLDEGRNKVYGESPYDLSKTVFTPLSARQRMEQAKFIVKRLPLIRPEEQEPEFIIDEPEVVTEDEPNVEVPADDSEIIPEAYVFEEDDEDVSDESDDFIDTDDYVFEEEERPSFRPESFFSNYRKFEKKSRVIGPQPYEPRFSFNNLITSFAVDPLIGFSILVETEINDLLENHRLNGGVLTTPNLRSGNIFGEYQFLKYWMDFHLRYDRKSYLVSAIGEQGRIDHRYSSNRIEAGAAVPLTNTFRLELSPFYANTVFDNLQWQAISPNSSGFNLAEDNRINYGGIRAAMVLDNTIEKGFNIYQGTRGLLEYENYVGVTDAGMSFSKLKLDLRHYQKIHKEFTLAGRLFYGKSMGPNAQAYMVGGVQNWLFRSYENQGENGPLAINADRPNNNLLFSEFVTNLRGFNFNEIFGTDALVFNAELRFPVFRYFASGPITSTFLRNFQLIGFYDIGTAWTGKPPFTKDGSTFTKKYPLDVEEGNEPAFTAEIVSFQNPWLAGYGFGARTVILGYYLKLDVARPIKDYQVGNTRYYLTLGLDF